MTPPTPAESAADALERVAVETGQHGPSMLAALAASGWQVTREGEGLRAALDEAHSALGQVLALVASSPDILPPATRRLTEIVTAAREQARAALASGEDEKSTIATPEREPIVAEHESGEERVRWPDSPGMGRNRAALASGEEGQAEGLAEALAEMNAELKGYREGIAAARKVVGEQARTLEPIADVLIATARQLHAADGVTQHRVGSWKNCENRWCVQARAALASGEEGQ